MSCFPCFGSQRSKRSNSKRLENALSPRSPPVGQELKKQKPEEGGVNPADINAKTFTFRELATATKNFRQECLLGEGGFGRVYKGTLQSSGQVVAVKQLDRNGMQGNKEFLGDVLTLSLLHHPNLVNLIGYCADGDQRLLVYEYISGGSVDELVLGNGPDEKALDWYSRIKIAYGTALGLEYLHEKANPPVIYRDLKSSNILLDEELNPKLSDVGLAKLGPDGDKMHGPSRLMETYGFCAPEYSGSGEVTMKSDVYSFGVILLELITGRRAIDTTRSNIEQNLVSWAQPLFRDPKKYPDMADPLLNKQFPEKDLNQAVAIASMCLQEEAGVRPFMSDVVTTLSFLSTTPPPEAMPAAPLPAHDPAHDDNNDGGDSECVSEVSDYEEDQEEASDRESTRGPSQKQNQNKNRPSYDDIPDDDEVSEENESQGTAKGTKEWHSFARNESNSSHKSGKGIHDHNQDTVSSQVSSNQSKYASVSSRSSSRGSTEESVSNNSRKNSQKISQKQISSSKGEISSEDASVCTDDQKNRPPQFDANHDLHHKKTSTESPDLRKKYQSSHY